MARVWEWRDVVAGMTEDAGGWVYGLGAIRHGKSNESPHRQRGGRQPQATDRTKGNGTSSIHIANRPLVWYDTL